MSAALCSKCERPFEAGDAAAPPDEVLSCPQCRAFDGLLQVADELVAWRGKVEITPFDGNTAADQLAVIVEMAKTAGDAARALR
ncbi:MAG: hypothetical protein AAB721_02875 [Patescibacteria group bacterium]